MLRAILLVGMNRMRVGAQRFSSLENGPTLVLSLIDRIKDKTEIDAEKELFKVKRNMGAFHSKGQYSDALHCALELESAIELLMGRHTAMFASALNNVALMNKMLGNFIAASDKYTQSLVIYDEVVGRKHASYAATLHNLGVLYREQAAADKSHGGPDSAMEREQLLARAEEALGDALSLRLPLLGTSHKDTISTTINLAALLRQTKRAPRAEEMLREALATSRLAHGDFSSVTASCLNALGLLLKQSGVVVGEGEAGQSAKPVLSSVARRREARRLYEEALHARSATLGDAHPDTIVSMHNLAELLLEDAEAEVGGEGEGGARGVSKMEREKEREKDRVEASRLQKRIVTVVERIKGNGTSAGVGAVGVAQEPQSTPSPAPPLPKPKPVDEPPPFTYATRRRPRPQPQ